MTNQQLWQAVLGELELSISRANFTTWFKNTFVASWENEKVIVGVPNTFTKTWLEKKYLEAILKIIRNLTQEKIKEIIFKVENCKPAEALIVQIKTESQESEALAETEAASPLPEASVNEFGLNSRYNFLNFIVGKGNELAHAASLSVVEMPGQTYNPLFIYGGTGLGKTHLLQAIGHEFLKKTKKILYVTCERFTNDYIQAVKNGQAKYFNDQYRNTDLLLIDDFQFIAGKEGTQEAFFHAFNALHQNNKQVVMTSDRPPKAIPSLESRLQSRLDWGMVVDISQPDLETRIAILEAKCREKGLSLAKEITNYIATVIHNNVRELEGALNKIIAHQNFHKESVDLNGVKHLLGGLANIYKGKALTPKQLVQAVAEYFDLAIEDLTGQSRRKELVEPRQIVMYLMREELKTSYPTIGQELGKRDHTTAMHAYGKVAKNLENDEKLRQDLLNIKQKVYSIWECRIKN